MKTKQERIEDSVKRIIKLKDEVILRYSEDINYDEELSLYDVMMEHFVNGDLDDVFLTDTTKEMSDAEAKQLFDLVRPYVGLCFAKGDVDYWLDSVENAMISDYEFIAASIFDTFDYLLEVAKDGGKNVLDQLVALRECEFLHDEAVLQYLRNTFVNDQVLKTVLVDMAKEDSYYKMFSNEQKGILLNYPEGTLYSYGDGNVRITSPLILGSKMFNDFNQYISDELIGEVTDQNVNDVMKTLSSFFEDDSFNFADTALDLSVRYSDYMLENNIVLNNETMNIVYDNDGEALRKAWDSGTGVLGSSYEIPYVPGTK